MASKIKCKKCKKNIDGKKFLLNLNVCPYCNYHGYIDARERINITVDSNSFIELGQNINSLNFLNFYDQKS